MFPLKFLCYDIGICKTDVVRSMCEQECFGFGIRLLIYTFGLPLKLPLQYLWSCVKMLLFDCCTHMLLL